MTTNPLQTQTEELVAKIKSGISLRDISASDRELVEFFHRCNIRRNARDLIIAQRFLAGAPGARNVP